MEKEQKIAEIREELQRIAKARETGAKANVWNLLRKLGVDERIINNPNPNNLGMGIDFDSFLQGLSNANITIGDDGSVSLKTDIGRSYLVKEGKEVAGMDIAVFVKDGEFHMGCTHRKDGFHATKENFDMIVVPYGSDYAVRTRTSEYSLASEYSREKQGYETIGNGTTTISDFDKNGIECASNKVSYSNTPNINVNTYSGFDTESLGIQASCTRDYVYAQKELTELNPNIALADKNSAFFVVETMARRLESVDKTQISTWEKGKASWEHRYHLPLTGEYDMSKILNNSESCATPEELEEVRTQRLEEGWYDRKIQEYQQKGGTTATTIASLLEQEKLKLEETKGKSL